MVDESNEFSDQLRRVFECYNPDVMRAITHVAWTSLKLREACRQIGLAASNDDVLQMRILAAYIDEAGPDAFLIKWNALIRKGDQERGRGDAPPRQTKEQLLRAAQTYRPRVLHTVDDDSERRRWAMPRYADARLQADTPLPAPQGRTPAPAQSDKALPETDRRSGKERRKGVDRRADSDLIFKNKRYGKDRRSGLERRKNWKPTA